MATNILGYYSLLETSAKDGYIGAILIIDTLGKPVEFRTTYPIKPTMVQKQLYGDSLMPYLNIELCGQPLYQALTHKPPILLVENEALLPLTQNISGRIVQLTPFNGTLSPLQKQLTSPGNQFEPLVITFLNKQNNNEQALILNQLTDFFKTVNLLEPFQRIAVALQALAEQDPHFR